MKFGTRSRASSPKYGIGLLLLLLLLPLSLHASDITLTDSQVQEINLELENITVQAKKMEEANKELNLQLQIAKADLTIAKNDLDGLRKSVKSMENENYLLRSQLTASEKSLERLKERNRILLPFIGVMSAIASGYLVFRIMR